MGRLVFSWWLQFGLILCQCVVARGTVTGSSEVNDVCAPGNEGSRGCSFAKGLIEGTLVWFPFFSGAVCLLKGYRQKARTAVLNDATQIDVADARIEFVNAGVVEFSFEVVRLDGAKCRVTAMSELEQCSDQDPVEGSMHKVIYFKAYPEVCRLIYLPEAAGETCNNILLTVGLGSILLSSAFMLICVLWSLVVVFMHDRFYLWSLGVVVAVVCLTVVAGLYGIGCLSMLYDITHGRPSLVEVLDEPSSDMRDLAVAYGSSSNITNINT